MSQGFMNFISHADLFSIPTFLHVLRTYASSCIPSGQLTRSILNIPQRSTIQNIYLGTYTSSISFRVSGSYVKNKYYG